MAAQDAPPATPTISDDDKERNFLRAIEFEADWDDSIMGSLPCFDDNGDFPYPDIPFNSVNQHLPQLFGHYEPEIAEDISLQCIWPGDLPYVSQIFFPTHVFDSPSVFVTEQVMYVLPRVTIPRCL
ncbi:uncharacterized protein LOC142346055 [Convolutriloba macropyga]|uniref:uncharacterized protein LOC142346055 n=1 Tax=Convolutriloba macropyga TaxID=536237 RepID=UPI003F521BB7